MKKDSHRRPERPRPTPKKIAGVISVTRSGKGFFIQEGGDIEVPKEWIGTALSGDVVEVELGRKYGKQMARVLRVIERKTSSFVGTIASVPGGLVLKPDNSRVHFEFPLENADPKDIGMKAVVAVTSWDAQPPTAAVQQILGKAGDHETEMRAIVAARGFDMNFPKAVTDEAEKLYEKAWDEEEIESREDFRTTLTFTIDPDDAKDFDDAISYKELDDGAIEIGVHIADVSHFVRPGTAIDQEAFKRATSVYLVDRTIPMLPPQLSEDLCSLRPDEDRLTFSAIFTVNKENAVVDRRFVKGIIRSEKRFTYDEADTALADSGHPLHRELSRVWSFASRLRKQRFKDGAIMFDVPEIKPVLNEKKEVVSFTRIEYTDSHKLIEDLMLLANREVAAYASQKLGRKNRMFVYRIHDVPNVEKIEELLVFLRAIGHQLSVSPKGVKQQELNSLFKEIEGTPEEQLIRTATIRSMAKAVYATKNIGHFGLSFDDYTHFTSPIRRYPDLMVHRLLFDLVSGRMVDINPDTQAQKLIHASEKEAAAAEAERVSVKRKQVEYFAHLIGEKRTGVVSGITEWGIFISDDETAADGMVRIMSMTDDTYELDQKNFAVVGRASKRRIRLGDPVSFTVEKVDLDEQTIDLRLAA